ncbi:MAG: pyruvate formate-lyase-activating protein [Bacilli bacterium]
MGYINKIETLGFSDGPGLRVVVFLQGCTLRCIYCHNPETWKQNEGLKLTPDQLVEQILKYKNYFDKTGGVTFSGGEPLLQNEFLLETLKLCKKNNIHTCLDTAGIGDNYQEIIKYTDLIMFDIKGINSEDYKYITGSNIERSLLFLNECQKQNKKLWIRYVIVPDFNDTKEYILKFKDYISKIQYLEKVEFLPYHTLGLFKYKELGIPYRLKNTKSMDKEKCNEFLKILEL